MLCFPLLLPFSYCRLQIMVTLAILSLHSFLFWSFQMSTSYDLPLTHQAPPAMPATPALPAQTHSSHPRLSEPHASATVLSPLDPDHGPPYHHSPTAQPPAKLPSSWRGSRSECWHENICLVLTRCRPLSSAGPTCESRIKLSLGGTARPETVHFYHRFIK